MVGAGWPEGKEWPRLPGELQQSGVPWGAQGGLVAPGPWGWGVLQRMRSQGLGQPGSKGAEQSGHVMGCARRRRRLRDPAKAAAPRQVGWRTRRADTHPAWAAAPRGGRSPGRRDHWQGSSLTGRDGALSRQAATCGHWPLLLLALGRAGTAPAVPSRLGWGCERGCPRGLNPTAMSHHLQRVCAHM